MIKFCSRILKIVIVKCDEIWFLWQNMVLCSTLTQVCTTNDILNLLTIRGTPDHGSHVAWLEPETFDHKSSTLPAALQWAYEKNEDLSLLIMKFMAFDCFPLLKGILVDKTLKFCSCEGCKNIFQYISQYDMYNFSLIESYEWFNTLHIYLNIIYSPKKVTHNILLIGKFK